MLRSSRVLRLAAVLAAAIVVPACGGGGGGVAPNPGTIGFAAALFQVAEDGGSATITVRRSTGSLGAVSVNYSTGDGSAAAPGDYTAASGTLNWADGDAADKTFNVTIANDAGVEGPEAVLLTLSLPGGGALPGALFSATLTINDNDAPAGGVIQFSALSSSVSEGTSTLTVSVSRAGGGTGAVGVTYSSANGTATSPGDYTAVPGGATLSWADGEQGVKTFNVTIANDGAAEADEAFTLNLSAPTGGAVVGTVAAHVVTIQDDDANGVIQLAAAAFSVAEAGGTATITLTRANGSSGAVGVTIASANGTATSPGDYTAIAAATTVTWGAGDVAPKTVSIPIAGDAAVEGDETVLLSISAPTGGAALGGTTNATLTIQDDDCTLQLSAATYSQDEDGPVAVITVTRVGATAAPVSVNIASAAGTAVAGTDYTAAGGTLSWGANDGAAKTLNVPVTSDAAAEADETVNLTLSNASGLGAALGAQTTAVLTILDNDVVFSLSASAYSVGEGAGPLVVTVNRTGAPSYAVSVTWSNPAGGTAAGGGTDFTAAGGTLNFAAGDTSETFNVGISSDAGVEPDETFNLALSAPTIAVGTASLGTPSAAVATISDDDVNLQFAVASLAPSVNENGTSVTLTVRRLGLTTGAVSVQYSTAAGTASAGSDFTAVGLTTINWAAGDSADKTFNITILDDFLIEGNEAFSVNLSNPTGANASVGAGAGTSSVTITENDTPGTLQFSAASYSVGEAGPTATITVTRVGGVGDAVSAVVSTADGSATGADYTALNGATGLVSFAAGDGTSKTVDIAITNDILVESAETVNLSLGSFTGGATGGAQTTATLTINDDDVTLQFTAASFNVNENGGSVNLPVSRVGRSTGAVSVSYSVTGGTAATPADFTHTGTLSWGDGDTAAKNVVVTIVNDAIVEGDLTAVFTLNTPTGGASIGTQISTTLNILEDDTPGALQYTAANYNVNEGNVNATVTVSRTGGTGGAVTVNVTFPGVSTATSGVDFTVPGNLTLSWAAGEGGNKSLNIPILADALPEGTEQISLGLGGETGSPTIGAQSTATVSILDAPGTLQFTASNFNVNENGGTVAVTVSRTGGNGGAASVTWATSNGTALQPGDYASGSNTLSWNDGESGNKSFNVSVVSDSDGEGDETFNVGLSAPSGASLGAQSSATVTIIDDDTSFRFSSATYQVSENLVLATLTVERVGVLTGTDSVQWSTADGTAVAPDDYTASSGNTLNFTPGITSQQFTVSVADDTLLQGNLNFSVSLSNPSAGTTLGPPATATVTIMEDDSPGTLSFTLGTYAVVESAGTILIEVSRTGGSGGTVGVSFTTSNGTASQPDDYATSSGTLSWNPGEMGTKSFSVSIVNDTAQEGDESVNLTLSAPTGSATIDSGAATISIRDDDATILLSAASYTVSEGAGNLVVTVRRQNGSAGAVTATVSTSNGSALAGSDYTATSQNVTFGDGITTDQTVNVPILDDATQDPGESFTVTVTIFSGSAVVGTPSSATVSITDNEGPSVVSVSPADDATGVALDANVVITFSTAMDTALTEAAISISRNPTSSPLPTINFVWSAGDTVVTLVLDTAAPSGGLSNVFADDLLSENTTYTVTVGAGATAAGPGLPIGAASVTDFTTVLDATGPSVVSVTPNLDNPVPSGVPGTVFTVTFSEPMDTSEGFVQIRLGESQIDDSIGSAGNGMTIAWTSSTTLEITVTDALPSRTPARLEVNGGSDVAGNFLADSDDISFFTDNPGVDTTAPVVTGGVPAPGAASVSRDAPIILGFSELMRKSLLNHVTIGGTAAAGVTVEKDMEGDDLPILFIRPLKAWEVGTLTVTINCAAGGAMDLKGNLLTANSGSNYVATFTVVAGTNDGTILEINPDQSGIQDGQSRIHESQYESYFIFNYNLTGFRAYVNATTLTARDVSITHFQTGIPVKGHRLSASEEGDLRISRFASNHLTPLEYDQLYNLQLNTTLRSSRGTPLPSPVTYTFSTRESTENAAVQIIRPPEIEANTFLGQALPELRIRCEVVNSDAGDGNQTSSVTVTSTTSFSNTKSSSAGTSFFSYQFGEEDGEVPTGLTGTGFRIFQFSAKDNASPDDVDIETQAHVFNQATELTATLSGPPTTATSTPTMTWSWPGGTVPTNAHGQIVNVARVLNPGDSMNESEEDAYFVLTSRTATSLSIPADHALPSGTYRFYLGIVRFKDPNGGGGSVDFGVMGPREFTVP